MSDIPNAGDSGNPPADYPNLFPASENTIGGVPGQSGDRAAGNTTGSSGSGNPLFDAAYNTNTDARTATPGQVPRNFDQPPPAPAPAPEGDRQLPATSDAAIPTRVEHYVDRQGNNITIKNYYINANKVYFSNEQPAGLEDVRPLDRTYYERGPVNDGQCAGSFRVGTEPYYDRGWAYDNGQLPFEQNGSTYFQGRMPQQWQQPGQWPGEWQNNNQWQSNQWENGQWGNGQWQNSQWRNDQNRWHNNQMRDYQDQVNNNQWQMNQWRNDHSRWLRREYPNNPNMWSNNGWQGNGWQGNGWQGNGWQGNGWQGNRWHNSGPGIQFRIGPGGARIGINSGGFYNGYGNQYPWGGGVIEERPRNAVAPLVGLGAAVLLGALSGNDSDDYYCQNRNYRNYRYGR